MRQEWLEKEADEYWEDYLVELSEKAHANEQPESAEQPENERDEF